MQYFGIFIASMAASVSAGGIAWYVDNNCAQGNGPYSYYTGALDLDKAELLIPGEPPSEPNFVCEWRLENMAEAQVCTAPMNPPPASFVIDPGTQCWMGHHAGMWQNGPYDGDEMSGKCLMAGDIAGGVDQGEPIYFLCYNTD